MLSVRMNSYVIMTIATTMLVAATTIATISTPVLASVHNDPQRNDFGEGARHIGGGMGEHSSEQDEPRDGIGNVLNEGDPKVDDNEPPDSKHPADLANALCSGPNPDPNLCP